MRSVIKEYPLISIVTPSFNQVQFLEATINSVLNQNYPNLEYIIIDGGSDDGSVDIIKKYEKHLHFWCSQPDAGQYDAINKGFAHSTGEIMAWMNSDDMYFPWAFRTVASILSELPEVEWITTLQQGGWDWDGFCRGFKEISGYSKKAFLDGCYLLINHNFIGWIQQESTFWRRSLWEKAGYHICADLKLAGDFELWSRFFNYADLYGTNSPLGGFRTQMMQKTQRIEDYISEAKDILFASQKAGDWHSNYCKDFHKKILFYSNLNKIPKAINRLMFFDGYSGKKVVKNNIYSPDGFWEIQNYNFIY